MAKSNYLANLFLNSVFTGTAFTAPASVYAALYIGNPASGGTEVSGGSYIRKLVASTTSVSAALTNTNALTYNNMPAANITYVGFFDSLSGGNLLYFITVPVQSGTGLALIATNNGDTVAIPINGITVTES